MKSLSKILKNIETLEIIGEKDIAISSIVFDSRKACKGSLFVAVTGTKVDGHNFIEIALKSGSSAIMCERLPDIISPEITYIKVKDSSKSLGYVANNYYDNPSEKLDLIGITGTNGKTTVATLLFNLFKKLNYKVGLLSTVQNEIIDEIIPSTHTTPDSLQINHLLHSMVDHKCTHCFMEVSSHAITQKRTAGLKFRGGVFTNITHDHLDFHQTFRAYTGAKKKFFDSLPEYAFAVINKDDKRSKIMVQNSKAEKFTYGLSTMCDFKAKIIENHFSGMQLNIDGVNVWFKLFGKFNAYNLLAVYTVSRLLGQDKTKVFTELSNLNSVPGRLDFIKTPHDIVGIVDYAHTPDALKNVLTTIKEICKQQQSVITVVGCGGDRDKTKRPKMAKIASELSNKVILTADNPRSEDSMDIINDMKSGISHDSMKKVLTISDRKEAIKTACALAKTNDVILIAGKGHEKYQEVKGIKYPFNDKEILKESLENLQLNVKRNK